MVNSYFELNVVRCLDEGKVYNDERIRFHSLVEAEHEMLRISKNPFEFEKEEIFCFIIREIPFGVLSVNGDDDCLTERVYLSFYTFQAVGYLVDVHGEKYEAEKSFPRFLLFVSFFPQLVQGPINRYGKMGPQFLKEHSWSGERAKRAVILILFGVVGGTRHQRTGRADLDDRLVVGRGMGVVLTVEQVEAVGNDGVHLDGG